MTSRKLDRQEFLSNYCMESFLMRSPFNLHRPTKGWLFDYQNCGSWMVPPYVLKFAALNLKVFISLIKGIFSIIFGRKTRLMGGQFASSWTRVDIARSIYQWSQRLHLTLERSWQAILLGASLQLIGFAGYASEKIFWSMAVKTWVQPTFIGFLAWSHSQ